MKLRNKKTGEIVDYISFENGGGKIAFYSFDTAEHYYYNSLAKLNEEWEDYEEPKEYWYLDYNGTICNSNEDPVSPVFMCKEIGNYFETKEEAEKAVEKLKALKKLRDKGFKFIDHIDRDTGQGMARYEWDGYVNGEDLDLLFGGEE